MAVAKASPAKRIEEAFTGDDALREVVLQTIKKYPETGPVFERVTTHYESIDRPRKRIQTKTLKTKTKGKTKGKLIPVVEITQPIAEYQKPELTAWNKKKGYERGQLLGYSEIDFKSPVRSSLFLYIDQDVIAGWSDEELECSIDVPDVAYMTLLPVPERTTERRQFNFCLFPKQKDADIVVFNVMDGCATTTWGQVIRDPDLREAYVADVILFTLNELPLPIKVERPSTDDFVSTVPQPPIDDEPCDEPCDEPAVHVAAQRGEQDGFLFFLPSCLVYGFRKPLLWIPLRDIRDITYTDIREHSFTLIITRTTSSSNNNDNNNNDNNNNDNNNNDNNDRPPNKTASNKDDDSHENQDQDRDQAEDEDEDDDENDAEDDEEDDEEEQEDIELSRIDMRDYDNIDKYMQKYNLTDASPASGGRAV